MQHLDRRGLFIPKAPRTRLKGEYHFVFQLPSSRYALSHHTISDCECSQLRYLGKFPVFCFTLLSEDSNEPIRPVIVRYDIERVLQNDRNGTYFLASTVLTALEPVYGSTHTVLWHSDLSHQTFWAVAIHPPSHDGLWAQQRLLETQEAVDTIIETYRMTQVSVDIPSPQLDIHLYAKRVYFLWGLNVVCDHFVLGRIFYVISYTFPITFLIHVAYVPGARLPSKAWIPPK